MKNALLPLLVLITLSIAAQTYHPFPTDSVTWSVGIWTPPDYSTQNDNCIARHYGFAGDTLIEGQTYSKMYGNNLAQDFPYEDIEFNLATATYLGAVREDTTRKVWIRMADDEDDLLYYDFALEVGDTFCFEFFGPGGCDPVTEVDSVFINGTYRRTIIISMNTGHQETWIEGIGSTTGWFEMQYVGTNEYKLKCCHENGVELYYDPIYGCHCDTFTSVYDHEDRKWKANIYPIPGNDILHVELVGYERERFKYLISTSDGIRIKTITLAAANAEIDISDLPDGVYFLSIQDQMQNQTTMRFIKIGD